MSAWFSVGSLLLNLARVTSLSVAESARIGASVSVASGLFKTPIFNKSGDNYKH